jgi:hypothetical protein
MNSPDHAAGLNKVQVRTDQGDRLRENDSRAFWAAVHTKERGSCSIKSGGKGHNSVTAGLGRDAAKELNV